MTDNKKEDKPKKLTLGSNTLSLNKRSFDSTNITKSFLGSKSNVVVEVRKSRAAPLNFGNLKESGEKSDDVFTKRMDILKKAADESKTQDQKVKYTTLSELAAINKSKISEETKTSEPENDEISDQKSVSENSEEVIKAKLKSKSTQEIKDFAEDFDEEDEASKKKASDLKNISPKVKLEEPRKLKKTDIFHMLDGDDEVSIRKRSLASIKRAKDKERRKQLENQKQEKIYREVIIPESISVGELANRMSERVGDVVKELMKFGVMANSSQYIDADTAELVTSALGHSIKRVQESDIENILIQEPDENQNLIHRAPIVTVMGHVDHGKTSLLDALKSTDVVAMEAGGITQHIGAYNVHLADGRSITFIDTPGHEAFTNMRMRGAKITDIVVLVVAADDGIKTQTIEAINHAKAANVPIIVAINKIDKPDINIEKVKQALLTCDLVPEDLGGDVMVIPVSALKRLNLDKLEEAILLVAEMQDLKSNPNIAASGVVIEARIDKNMGVVTTILIQRGTLKKGDLVVAGSSFGRVKRINNDKAIEVDKASLSEPVEIFGLNDAPSAGDSFNVVENEKQARDITEYRKRLEKDKKISIAKKVSLEDLFQKASGSSNIKDINLIIKGDVQGSVEAIIGSLSKIESNEVKIKILHLGVGAVGESDVALAKASNAIIIGFNVRANPNATLILDKEKIDIRYYSIIYNLIDDIRSLMQGLLSPIIREQYIGSVDIRQVFNITRVGIIAGSYVTKGIIRRGSNIRLLRDNVVIYEGKLKTLKRFKDDVKEVRENYECGIEIENYSDVKVGDKLEVFELIEEKQKLL